MRRYNWLVFAASEEPMKRELASIFDQICQWPVNRAVERTIPHVRFAQCTEIINCLLVCSTLWPLKRMSLNEQCKLASLPTLIGTMHDSWKQE